MTGAAAFRSFLVFGLLMGLSESAIPALAQDAAGSTPNAVLLRAVVLPTLSIQLSSGGVLRSGEASELVAYWNLGSGQNTSVLVLHSPGQPPLDTQPTIVMATYRGGASGRQRGAELSANPYGSATPLTLVSLATYGRLRPGTEPFRLPLPRTSAAPLDTATGTLDIRVQAI